MWTLSTRCNSATIRVCHIEQDACRCCLTLSSVFAGYGHTNGCKTTPEQLTSVFSGLEVNGLGRWAKVLTGMLTIRLRMRATVDLAPLGYIPGASALTVVGDEVRKLKERAESAKYKEDVVYLLDRECNLPALGIPF